MSTKISSPEPPQQPSTAEAVQAWADVQPQIMQQQLEFAPLEAQQQVDLAQQYALPLAQVYQDAQKVLYPETSAIQEQFAQKALEGVEQGLTDQEREEYADYFKSQLGVNIGSGIGAKYFADNMVAADQARKDYYANLGLSLAGRQPLSSPMVPQTSNYMSQFTPNSVMGFQAQNYGNYANTYGQMYNANANMQSSMNQMYGQMFSSAAGAAGMAMM